MSQQQLIVDIEGMSCSGCEAPVVAALQSVPGVSRAVASFADGVAHVQVEPEVDPSVLEKAVGLAGYTGKVRLTEKKSGAGGSRDTDFDLVVLGGGSAGFAAAIKGVESGARVALVNHGILGGTCVNVGCIPSKALIRAAEANHRRQHHGFSGVPTTNGASNWPLVRGQKDALVKDLRQAKYWDVLKSYPDISLFEQRGTVGADATVTLDDTTILRAGKIIVATGSSPHVASVPGLAEAGFLDSTTAMDLETLPQSLIVIGASLVGMELGQMFARLGARVTVLSRRSVVLPQEDPAIGDALTRYLRDEGLDILHEVTIERVERNGDYTVHYLKDGSRATVSGEQLLMATGRRANTRGFGLDAASIELGQKGEIVVDDYLQATNPDVYAAGDVTGDPMHVYVAAYAGALAAENALGGNGRHYDVSAVPRVTFTDPAAAAVGMTEAQAREKGLDPITSVLPLEHVPRALAAHDTRGFVKLVADAGTRRILGAHILAAEAGEMIMEPTLAIKFGLTIEDLTSTFHPYLTLSEAIKLAAQTFDKDVSQLSCCAA